jgi:hypothetical protein
MRNLCVILLVLLAACAHRQPTKSAGPLSECVSRYDALEERYCAFHRAETAASTLPESLGTLTQDSAMFVVECGKDHPSFETACDGR